MRNKATDIVSVVTRLLLGLTFLFSGIVKAIDPLGTTYKIEDYLKAFGGFFTDLLPLAEPAAFALITVECLLGICLVCNIQIRLVAWLSLLFYLVMTPLTLYLALKNPVSDCGCFGDAVVLTNWQTFGKNVVLLTLVIVLLQEGLASDLCMADGIGYCAADDGGFARMDVLHAKSSAGTGFPSV